MNDNNDTNNNNDNITTNNDSPNTGYTATILDPSPELLGAA